MPDGAVALEGFLSAAFWLIIRRRALEQRPPSTDPVYTEQLDRFCARLPPEQRNRLTAASSSGFASLMDEIVRAEIKRVAEILNPPVWVPIDAGCAWPPEGKPVLLRREPYYPGGPEAVEVGHLEYTQTGVPYFLSEPTGAPARLDWIPPVTHWCDCLPSGAVPPRGVP